MTSNKKSKRPTIFSTHDDYMTPRSAWENIKEYIPENKVIWEAFYGDGQSGKDLQDILKEKNRVIHEPIDFFKNLPDGTELIQSNPPFSCKKEIFTRLRELDLPFIMICPVCMLITQYIRQLFSDTEHRLQIIIPRKRIQFIKLVDGKIPDNWKSQCNFDCFYYCYKINLERDITWLE